MRTDPRSLGNGIRSASGLAFLVGILLVGLPAVFPPASTTATWTEIVAGLSAMALGAWAAWQGRLARSRAAFAPAVGIVVVAVALALLALVEPLGAMHVAGLAVLAVTLFLTGTVDAVWAARAGGGPREAAGLTRRA